MLLGGSASIYKFFHDRIIHDFFYKNIRTGTDFENYLNTFLDSIEEYCEKASFHVSQILENYQHTWRKLEILKTQNKAIQPIMDFLHKIDKELKLLMPNNFLLAFTNNELAFINNFIRALSIRAERGCASLAKDSQKEEEIVIFKKALDHENSILPENASEKKKQALRDLFLFIEEYKVSVFAPEIKSRIKVSAKRLGQILEEIRKMK